MRHIDYHAAIHNVWIGEYLIHIIDGTAADGQFLKLGQPFLRRACREHRFHQRDKSLAITDAGTVRGEALVFGQFHTACELAEPLKLGVVADEHAEICTDQ